MTPDYSISRNSLNWGGDSFPSYQGFMNTPAAAAPASGGEGSGSGSPASSSGASSSGSPAAGSTGASPTPSGAQGGSPSPNGNNQAEADWTTAPAHFRDAYQKLKGDYERYSGLGDFETVKTHAGFVQTIVNEAYTNGEALGYTEAEVEAALNRDAVMAISFLRSKAQQLRTQNGQGQGQGQQNQGQNQNQDEAVRKLVEKEINPIREHINQQQTDAANNRFDTEFQRQLGEAYGEEVAQLPPKFRKLLYDATSEIMKYDSQGISDLKFGNKVAAVAKHFAAAKAAIEEGYAEFSQYQTKRAGRSRPSGGGNRQAAEGDNEGLTLDDVIAGNDKALKKIPSMRQGR